MKESQLKYHETQFQTVFSKSGSYGTEICCVTSKLTLKSRDVLYFFHKQPLVNSNCDKSFWKWSRNSDKKSSLCL